MITLARCPEPRNPASESDLYAKQEEAAAAYLQPDARAAAGSFRAEVFFHIGFVNFKTWRMSVLHLVPRSGGEHIRTLWLEHLERIENGFCEPPGESLQGDAASHLAEISTPMVSTLLQALLHFIDFRRSYTLSFWQLCCDGPALPPEVP